MSSTLDIVKNAVRRLRTERDLSQAALGSALGVSRQTVNSIETARYLPSLPLALQIARFFETTVEEVFDVDD
ncbi:helix-turn-helix transcriptional regulator [Nocardioides panacisoli]|uniref:helix-turn-helix transcriptional regulator n=1 Tax=Nocardioides panacisoli TaxID=627624 RepID=UPI001F16F690|nr:helix-turn-helix transcriptional regulator [Nocardioides panacisoli]